MKLVTREKWGARPTRGTSHLASTLGVKVHYTGDPEDPAMLADHDLCARRVRSIQAAHMDGNRWNDIGYSAVVCPHGYVFVGRGPHVLPAANGSGLNSGHYAVCGLVGKSGIVKPTDAMLNGIRDAITWLRDTGAAGGEIRCHKDGYQTDCPGGPLTKWVREGAPRPAGGGPHPDPRPQPTGPPWPGRVLTQPPVMHGDDVRAWQRQMQRRDWVIVADGAYGPDSEAVCRKFQREKGLSVDGQVGPKTWAAAWNAPVTK